MCVARIRSLRVLFAEVKKRRPEGYDREGGISEKQAKKEAKRKRKAERKAAKAAKEAEKAGSCFKRKKNDAEDAGAASGEGAPGEPDQGVEAPKLDVEKITDVFKRLVSLRCLSVACVNLLQH